MILMPFSPSILQAQFYIIEKIKTEVGFIRIQDVHLRSEIAVPKAIIGRIIGKGGQHVSTCKGAASL